MADKSKVNAMADNLTESAYYESATWPDKMQDSALLMLAADMLRESIGEAPKHGESIREELKRYAAYYKAPCNHPLLVEFQP